jgi:hypothetical protein
MGVASRVPRLGRLAGEVIELVKPGLALAGGPYLSGKISVWPRSSCVSGVKIAGLVASDR